MSLAFSITLIPLIGPVLYWIVASILALFTSPVTALIFAVIYLIYIQLEAYVLTPRVMNRAVVGARLRSSSSARSSVERCSASSARWSRSRSPRRSC